MYNLFLDDIRFPKDVYWVKLPLVEWTIVRNYAEFIETIQKRGLPLRISFDHDLGEQSMREAVKKKFKSFDYNAIDEKTGYHAAKWLCDYCLDLKLELPEYYIHTINPVGRENIESYLENFKRNGQT